MDWANMRKTVEHIKGKKGKTALNLLIISVLIVILLLVLFVVWFRGGKPNIRANYVPKMNESVHQTNSPEGNAWPYYQEAFLAYQEPNDGLKLLICQDNLEQITLNQKRYLALSKYPAFPKLSQGQVRYLIDYREPVESQRKAIKTWLEARQKDWELLGSEEKEAIFRRIENYIYPVELFDSLIGAYNPESRNDNNKINSGTANQRYKYDVDALAEKIPEQFKTDTHSDKCDWRYVWSILNEWLHRSEENQQIWVQWITQNKEAWQKVATAAEKPYLLYEGEISDGLSLCCNPFEPFLTQIRQLITLGEWRVRTRFKFQPTRQIPSEWFTQLQIARQLQQLKSYRFQYYAFIIMEKIYQNILVFLDKYQLSAVELKKLQQQLRNCCPSSMAPFDYKGAEWELEDTIQRVFTEGIPGGGHLIPSQLKILYPAGASHCLRLEDGYDNFYKNSLTLACLQHAYRKETEEKAKALLGQLDIVARKTPYENHLHGINIDNLLKKLPRNRYRIIHHVMNQWIGLSEQYSRVKAFHEAIYIIIALQHWRQDKGTYPDSLQELVAHGYLDKLPDDPYGPGSLNYRKDNSHGFVLYSYAEDYDDDKGKAIYHILRPRVNDKDGDIVFWPLSPSSN